MAESTRKSGRRSAGATAIRSEGRARSGSFILKSGSREKARSVEVSLKPTTLKKLSAASASVGKVMESYGRALMKSRASGRPVRLVVLVTPEGEPTIAVHAAPAGAVLPVVEDASADLDRALAAARDRGQKRVAEIVGQPDMLSADDFASLLGTSPPTINTWRQKGRVLALEGAKRGFRYPSWQVDENGKPFAVLRRLFDHFGGSSWAVYRFLVQHHGELGGMTAIEALRRGRDEEVVEAAESVTEAFS